MSTGRNHHEIYLLVLTLGFAASSWSRGDSVIAATFPVWERVGWFVGLLLGALVALAGSMSVTVTGRLVERVGLLLLAGICGAYTAAFLAQGVAGGVSPAHVAYVVVFVGAFGAANLARAVQIGRGVGVLYRELAQLPSAP